MGAPQWGAGSTRVTAKAGAPVLVVAGGAAVQGGGVTGGAPRR